MKTIEERVQNAMNDLALIIAGFGFDNPADVIGQSELRRAMAAAAARAHGQLYWLTTLPADVLNTKCRMTMSGKRKSGRRHSRNRRFHFSTANSGGPPADRLAAPLSLDCPFSVPIAAQFLVFPVILVRAKGAGFWRVSRNDEEIGAGRKAPVPVCKTSIPGSNPGGASNPKLL